MANRIASLFLLRAIAIASVLLSGHCALFGAPTNTLQNIAYTNQGKSRTLLEFKTKEAPDYEIFENIKSTIILIKFRNTVLGSVPKTVVLDDPLIKGIRIQTIEDTEHWVKIKTNFRDMLFNIIRDPKSPGTIGLQLYRLDTATTEPVEAEITNVLRELTPKAEKFYIYSNNPLQHDIAGDSSNPDKLVQVRFFHTRLPEDLVIPFSETQMIQSIRFEKKENYLVMMIAPRTYSLKVKKTLRRDPVSLVLEISEDTDKPLAELEKRQQEIKRRKVEEDTKAHEKEEFLTVKFKEAEHYYRIGRFKAAALMFRNIFNAAPSLAIGVQANFRAADSLFQRQLARREQNGEKFVIQEYKSAINAALIADLGYDDIPRAYYNTGRSYLNLKHYEDAFNQFEILIKLYPESPYAKTALFHQGVVHFNMLRFHKVIETLQKYVEENNQSPKIPIAYYKLGEAHFQLKEFSEAKRSFDRAWSLAPDYMQKDAKLMFHMAETYFENGDISVARSIYEKLIDLFPNKPFSNLTAIRIGDLLRDEGKYDDAVRAYEKAINRYPQELFLVGKMRIANILAEQPGRKNFEKAIAVYDLVTKKHTLSDQFEEALLRKGFTLSLFQEYPQAISTMESFCHRFPDNRYVKYEIIHERILESIRSYIEHYYHQGEYLSALGVFEQYARQYYMHPENSACFQMGKKEEPEEAVKRILSKAPLFLIADSYDRLGLQDKALDIYDTILENKGNTLIPLALFNKGKIFDAKEKPEEARKIYEQFIHSYPNNTFTPMVKKALGDSSLKIHKPDRISRTIRIYQQTVEDYQNSDDMLQRAIVPPCWFALGNLYQDIGQYDNAIDAYKNVLNAYEHPFQDPEVETFIIETHFILGNLYYELNQIPEAYEAYMSAINLFPKSEQAPWAKYQIGQIYVKTKRKEKAMKVFEELMQAAKKNPDALWGLLAVESHKAIVNEFKFDQYLDRTPNSALAE